jgi:hypothetical protein
MWERDGELSLRPLLTEYGPILNASENRSQVQKGKMKQGESRLLLGYLLVEQGAAYASALLF